MQTMSLSAYPRISLLFFRSLLFALIVFEMLNQMGLLRFTLDFTWFGLIWTGLFSWICAEIAYFLSAEDYAYLVIPLVVTAVCLDAFGDILYLYSSVHGYDKALHFVNSGIATFSIWIAFSPVRTIHRHYIVLFCVCAGITLWTFYELEEFFEDVFINLHPIRFGNSFDTWGDLSMNVLGCIFVGIALLVLMRRKK